MMIKLNVPLSKGRRHRGTSPINVVILPSFCNIRKPGMSPIHVQNQNADYFMADRLTLNPNVRISYNILPPVCGFSWTRLADHLGITSFALGSGGFNLGRLPRNSYPEYCLRATGRSGRFTRSPGSSGSRQIPLRVEIL